MDSIIKMILDFVFILLFSVPGAAIRWIYFKGKRNYKDLLQDDPYWNAGVFIAFMALSLVVLFGLLGNSID